METRPVASTAATDELERSHSVRPAGLESDGRRLRGLRRRDSVLAAARALFIRDGYRATTLDAIIALAGGSRETIYGSLGGKRGLIRTILAKFGDQLTETMADAAVLDSSPREALTRFGHQLLEIWHSEEGRAMHRIVVSEGMDAPEVISAWYLGGPEPTIRALSRYLEAQKQSGHLTGLEPSLAARQFLALLMSEAAYPFLSGNRQGASAAATVDQAVDVLLKAYGPR